VKPATASTVKTSATATVKTSATTAVKTSATTAMASTVLSQRQLRQPRKRQYRHNNKSNSNQNSILHITSLGSRTPQSLDVRTSHKDSKPRFYIHSALYGRNASPRGLAC
jgi:hypothetical protein